MPRQPSLSRRALLRATALGGTGLLVARSLDGVAAAASPALINPYTGRLPLVFPLPAGTYQSPVVDNWHAAREGQLYAWNHRASKTRRAHDGVDVYPVAGAPLPTVYAPLAGTVVAVCTRTDNTLGATVTYQVSQRTPPPWDYHTAVDTVAGLPLYGNFVWLVSTDPASAGYFVFVCHLQHEPTLAGLVPDQAVTTATPLGVLGDTGNAAGTPQLHVELHYPAGATFSCTRCTPKLTHTNLDPAASLQAAILRAG